MLNKRYTIQWKVWDKIFTSSKRYSKKEALKVVEKANNDFSNAHHWVVLIRKVNDKDVYQRLDEIIM